MANRFDTTTTGSDAVLAYLQELVLNAAFLSERLPGSRRPLRLLANGRLLRELPSKIIRSNLAHSLKLDDLPRRIDLLTLEQLQYEDQPLSDEEVSFLAFRPPVWGDDCVGLSMVVGGIRREQGNWQCREFGHVDAEFHQIDGRWTTLGEPHVFLAPNY